MSLSILWKNSAPLTVLGFLMMFILIGNAFGLAVDRRIITGAAAWLKPAKFSLSTAIFAFTMAWLFGHITVWPKIMPIVGAILALMFVIEIAIIDVQAARGVASHFNTGTRLNTALYGVMGTSIAILWFAMLAITLALFRQNFGDTGFGWSLRLGMAITLVGAALGGLMTRPNPSQMEALSSHRQSAATGAHTVGGPDGGPGLPVTAWSVNHGDLRIPHFFGLHAVQLIPLLFWLFRRGLNAGGMGAPIAVLCGLSYAAFVALLLWQALRGHSIVQPDSTALTAFAAWLGVTIAMGVWILRTTPHGQIFRSAA